jgi:hypothetical protein
LGGSPSTAGHSHSSTAVSIYIAKFLKNGPALQVRQILPKKTLAFQFKQQELNAEREMLLCCSRTHLNDVVLGRVRQLLGGNLDWDFLLRTAHSHGVIPLLHLSLGKSGVETIPAAAFEQLQNLARTNERKSFLLATELLKLIRTFEAHNVDAIPFKGPVLAATAYGDETLRHFGDLDIAVRKDDIHEAKRILLSAGYSCNWEGWNASDDVEDAQVAYREPQYYTFDRLDGRSRVDLQWRLTIDYFAFSLDKDCLWKRLAPVSLAGKTIRSFDPTDMLLILCVHGSKHCWEKLKWVCDVAELLRAQKDSIDWQELDRDASTQRVQRMVGLGLFLAQDLLGADLPEGISKRLQGDTTVQWLAGRVRQNLFNATHRHPGRLKRIAFYLRVKDHWRDGVQFCLTYFSQWFKAAVTPNSADRTVLSLPGYLSFLYYFFRPIRLLTEYGRLMLTRTKNRVRVN